MAKKDKQAGIEQSMRKKKPERPSSQKYIPFAEIRDNTVIMKDGHMRAVILVSSLNFALKSEDEQRGVIQGYVQFLNSLDFELQIVMQSRQLNIDKYLEKLDQLARQQDNELLRKQTGSYRSFIAKLVEDAKIMDKKFYVVVPYSPFSNKKKNFWNRFNEVLFPSTIIKMNQEKFDDYTMELQRRIGRVQGGLQGVGLKTQQLDTQALIELYYNTYNPISKAQRRVEDITSMQVDRTVQ